MEPDQDPFPWLFLASGSSMDFQHAQLIFRFQISQSERRQDELEWPQLFLLERNLYTENLKYILSIMPSS
jgi:hypothetical protein